MTEASRIPIWLATLAVGLCGAVLFEAFTAPLPWMIGPLVFTALGRVFDRPLAVPPGTRSAGQWVIGIALGLYFTPEVAAQLGGLLPVVVAGAVAALAVGAIAGWLLRLLSGVDPATAYFAAMPGGASEMANLAARYSARIDLVAAAHSLRVMLVVIVIPAVYVGLDLHGTDLYAVVIARSDPLGLAFMAVLGAAGAWLWRRMGQPNAWIIGPLIVTAILTATGHALSAMPTTVSAAGQLFIGCSLGCRFSPRFLHEAPGFMLGSLAVTAFLLTTLAAAGVLLAWLTDLRAPSVILGLAPGGIAEMCITAKALQLGVPVVTAFHVVRIITVVVLCAPLFAWLHRAGPGD